jgi:NTP pyrophosphatase (non-canonical NTP hydrolase)
MAMSEWKPETDQHALARLGKLAEETGELQAAIARCIIQGIGGYEPVSGKPNREWLTEEIADVLAMIQHVRDFYGLNHAVIEHRVKRKYDMKAEWHAMLPL